MDLTCTIITPELFPCLWNWHFKEARNNLVFWFFFGLYFVFVVVCVFCWGCGGRGGGAVQLFILLHYELLLLSPLKFYKFAPFCIHAFRDSIWPGRTCHSLKELPLTSFERHRLLKICECFALIKISVLYNLLCVKLITFISGRENCKR